MNRICILAIVLTIAAFAGTACDPTAGTACDPTAGTACDLNAGTTTMDPATGVGCEPLPGYEICVRTPAGPTECTPACSETQCALRCSTGVGAEQSVGVPVPEPDPSLGCVVLPIPTPLGLTLYCCPCAQAGGEPPDGGPCEYRDIEGTCTITDIRDADSQANNCPNHPVEVAFDFAPSSGSTAEYLFPSWPDVGRTITIADGKNPPRDCVSSQGVIVGSEYACKRREETSGTCTPVLFELGTLDFSECQCF